DGVCSPNLGSKGATTSARGTGVIGRTEAGTTNVGAQRPRRRRPGRVPIAAPQWPQESTTPPSAHQGTDGVFVALEGRPSPATVPIWHSWVSAHNDLAAVAGLAALVA